MERRNVRIPSDDIRSSSRSPGIISAGRKQQMVINIKHLEMAMKIRHSGYLAAELNSPLVGSNISESSLGKSKTGETSELKSAAHFSTLISIIMNNYPRDSRSDGSDLTGWNPAEEAEPSREAEDCSCCGTAAAQSAAALS